MNIEGCAACHDSRRVFISTKRLIGATYWSDDPWKGDEHYELCPLCGLEAHSKGLVWFVFENIPQVFKHICLIMLCTDQIRSQAVGAAGTFKICCERWFNRQLLESVREVGKN